MRPTLQLPGDFGDWRWLEAGRMYASVRGVGHLTVTVEAPLLDRSPTHHLEIAYPGVRDLVPGSGEHLVTDEGEYAWLATASGMVDGARAHLSFGVIFGDREAVRVAGTSVVESGQNELDAAVERVVRSAQLGLGVRPRLFLYEPPPGWRGVQRELMTEWSPPTFPHELTLLTVCPAVPIVAPAETTIDTLLDSDWAIGFSIDAVSPPTPVYHPGLRGTCWTLVGRFDGCEPSLCHVVALRDGIYQYSFFLETPGSGCPEARSEALWGVVETTQPVPRPARPEASAVTAAFDSWSD